MGHRLVVTSVDLFKADIPFIEPFRIAIMVIPGAQDVFVRINTAAGLSGIGEATPMQGITGESQASSFVAAQELARLLIGRDPSDVEQCMADIDHFLVHNSSIRSAFDMALYDLLAKAAGMPLYALLGGGKRSFWTDVTIGLDKPERVAHKARHYQEQGFQAIKIKLGTSRAEDVARVRLAREAIGPQLPIHIDANQGWDFPTAAAVLSELEPLDVEYCEQPVASWDHENLRRVRQSTSIPIMADESVMDHHDAFKLAANGCCDYLNIKLAKSGGIYTALKINAVAESTGMACMMGSMAETRLGLSAAAHVVSSRPNIRYADLGSCLMLAEDPVIGGAQWDGGKITLPDTPGHGADIDPAFLDGCDKVTVQ